MPNLKGNKMILLCFPGLCQIPGINKKQIMKIIPASYAVGNERREKISKPCFKGNKRIKEQVEYFTTGFIQVT